MTLHIESGHPVMADARRVSGDKVRFVTEDGRTMFEVGVGRDGRSIEVSGVETTKHDGQIYDCWLLVQPIGANRVTIRTVKYKDS